MPNCPLRIFALICAVSFAPSIRASTIDSVFLYLELQSGFSSDSAFSSLLSHDFDLTADNVHLTATSLVAGNAFDDVTSPLEFRLTNLTLTCDSDSPCGPFFLYMSSAVEFQPGQFPHFQQPSIEVVPILRGTVGPGNDVQMTLFGQTFTGALNSSYSVSSTLTRNQAFAFSFSQTLPTNSDTSVVEFNTSFSFNNLGPHQSIYMPSSYDIAFGTPEPATMLTTGLCLALAWAKIRRSSRRP